MPVSLRRSDVTACWQGVFVSFDYVYDTLGLSRTAYAGRDPRYVARH